jgi:hypothetical protein
MINAWLTLVSRNTVQLIASRQITDRAIYVSGHGFSLEICDVDADPAL